MRNKPDTKVKDSPDSPDRKEEKICPPSGTNTSRYIMGGGKRTRKNLNPRVKIKTHNERNTKRAGKMYYAFGHSKRRS